MQAISSVPLADRQALCETGNGEGVQGTALQDIQTAYISRVNQYAGVLPPLIARDIQAIGVTAMSLKVGSYDEALRNEINTAINSQVSSTGGETGEVVAALIRWSPHPKSICKSNTNGSSRVSQHDLRRQNSWRSRQHLQPKYKREYCLSFTA
jgi:hypothetical protein